MASTKGSEPEERLADAQEETEQRMHSVADLLPNSEQITNVPMTSLIGQKSTAAEYNSAAPMIDTSRTADN